MDQDKTCEKLTGEIITELRLPVKLYWPLIFQKFQMAFAVGFNEGLRYYTHPRKVIQLTNEGKAIKVWNSIAAAEKALNISPGDISSCAKNKPYRNTAGGYKWKYA